MNNGIEAGARHAPTGAGDQRTNKPPKRRASRQPAAPASPVAGDEGASGGMAYCKIFPAIGIARLGNSPDEFLIGPEVPGLAPGDGSYKDAQGRVKRQAARSRVYAFDDRDQVVAELHADHPGVADLTWNVALANSKARWQFAGTRRVADILKGESASPRNADVQGAGRNRLVLGVLTRRPGAIASYQAMVGRIAQDCLDRRAHHYAREHRWASFAVLAAPIHPDAQRRPTCPP